MNATNKTKQVLIAEDERMLASAIKTTLMKEGVDCDTSFDGKEALRKTDKKEYDLILLDMKMPICDGFCFINAYKKDTPIIIITNNDIYSLKEEVARKKINVENVIDFIQKSDIHIHELAHYVKSIL